MPEQRPSHLVLVRHGETEWSRTARHTGRTDVPLTETGREQARRLGEVLRPWRFALVLCSPLRRAAETCELAGLGSVARLRDDLREWDYGDVEGRTTAEVRAVRPGWSLWRDGVEGGETVDAVGARADRILAEVAGVDGDVALVAHGHVLRILTARWLGLAPVEGRLFALATGAVSILGWEREVRVIWRWNDTCHLGGGVAPG